MYSNDQPFGYQTHRMGGYGQMQPMYQPYQPYQQAQPQQDQSVVCRIVTGEEEARAMPIDFSGKPVISYAPNISRTFIKAFNPASGSVDFDTYVKLKDAQKEQTEPAAPIFAPAGVVEQIQRLEATVTELQQEIRTMKNSKRKNAQEVAANDE